MNPGLTTRPVASTDVRSGGVGQVADGHDPIAAHPDVGRDRRRTAAVDDGPAADQQIEVHG